MRLQEEIQDGQSASIEVLRLVNEKLESLKSATAVSTFIASLQYNIAKVKPKVKKYHGTNR